VKGTGSPWARASILEAGADALTILIAAADRGLCALMRSDRTLACADGCGATP